MSRLSARLSLAILLTAAAACSTLPTGPDVRAADEPQLSKVASDTAATPADTSGGATTQGGYIDPKI